MKSLYASFLVLCLSLNSFEQKFEERYMYKYNGEDSLNLALISKERYNKQGKVVFAEYFDYFNDIITDESFEKGKYYYTYKDTCLIKELYAGYAYQYDVWGNAIRLDTSNFADSSITEYTYKYDSLNRLISKSVTDRYKSIAPGRCGWGSTIPKDTALFETEEWYRNSLIEEMNDENENQKNKRWTKPAATTDICQYYDDDENPLSIESVDNGKVYAYRRFRYDRDPSNKLVSKISEEYNDYSNYSGANHTLTLTSVTHTRYKNNCYIINRIHIYNMEEAQFTDTTATLRSRAVTYYLDDKKRVIQIHNKNDLTGDIYINRRKDGNITQIVTINNNASVNDVKHKITLLFKYK